MDITVTYKNGKWTTDPSPAIVAVGTRVRWILRAPDLENRKLVWKVSFPALRPFDEEPSTLKVMTRVAERWQRSEINMEVIKMLNLEDEVVLSHRGVTEIQAADRPGEFKYDLSVEDGETGKQISDDDPWLIVVRGVIRPFDLYVF